MERSSRRQFIARGALVAAVAAGGAVAVRGAGGPGTPPAPPPKRLRKLLDIGPGGVIDPGSAQDLRAAGNAGYFAETGTRWIRMWADWPSLQPSADHAPDDPRSPGRGNLRALDEQIALANARGIRVLLMPYRFPRWANGAREADERTRKAPEYRLPEDPYGPGSHWAGFFAFLHGRYHAGRETGPRVDGLELVNEPNLQLWPQRGVAGHVARLMATAQGVSARSGHTTMLYRPRSATTTPARTSATRAGTSS